MSVTCPVCFHHCSLEEGQTGRCKVRMVQNGVSIPLNYGKITSLALDPIEKKPLRKFFPGSKILSLGSFGCNLTCPFCQNNAISMKGPGEVEYRIIMPDEAARMALQEIPQGNLGLAYTYNEPLTCYEYVRDTAIETKHLGMKNVIVTNGCFTQDTALAVLPYTDALNIDLKSFRADTYKKLGGDLETVKKFIEVAHEYTHIELTTLIVPGLNDTKEEMEELSAWIASVDPAIPLHISRFFPAWKMGDTEPTDVRAVYSLAQTARKSLRFVYEGNC